ncbi:acyl carrier protein [Sorangium sp. So ce134]
MAIELDQVTEIIVTLSKIPGIGPDDDIYDAGVTSILAVSLIPELEERFNVTIPDDGRFPAARTPRALTAMLQELV